MPARAGHGQVRQLLVDVEERRAGNMSREVELAPSRGRAELPAAVDELRPHRLAR